MTTNIPAGWALVPLETLSRWRKWCLGYEWPKGQDWDSHDVYLAIADEIRTKYEDAIPPVDAVPGERVALSDDQLDGIRPSHRTRQRIGTLKSAPVPAAGELGKGDQS